MKKFARAARSLLLISASIGMGLGVAEVLVRVFGLAPSSNVETWSARTRTVHDGETRYFERVNSVGLRDSRELGLTGRSRQVVFLGDSFVWGQGVSNDELFSALTEASLEDQTGSAWTITAAGRSGIGTVEELRVLQGLLRTIRVDGLVVFYFVDNDPWDNLWEHSQDTGIAPAPAVAAAHGDVRSSRLKVWLYRHVALYRLLRVRLAAVGTLRDFPFRILDQCRPEKVDSFRKADELTRDALETMRQAVESRGGRFLGVVVIPRQEQLDDAAFDAFLSNYKADPTAYVRDLPQRRIIEGVLVPGGFQYLDLTEALAGHQPGEIYFPLDGHFNAAGHRLVAAKVGTWLLQNWTAPAPVAPNDRSESVSRP